MSLTISERQKATKITAVRYQKAAKKKKGAMPALNFRQEGETL